MSIKCIAAFCTSKTFPIYTYTKPIYAARYKWYLENVISDHPGYTLIADNVGYHWTPAVQQCVTQQLHMNIMRIPAYTPQLNPIEHIRAKMSNQLNQYGNTTLQQLEQRITEAYKSITVEECKKYAEHMNNVCNDIIQSNGLAVC